MQNIKEIAKIIKQMKTEEEVYLFLNELLTNSELIDVSKRWRILSMLYNGFSQREVAHELNVSLCKITRGSKIIKDKNAIVTRYLKKEI